jgi:catechol 2,3-dioxygenase-like lactoylglutathione lyase family enzyme
MQRLVNGPTAYRRKMTIKSPVLGVRHVALNVRDVHKSVEFYSNVLGMTLEWLPDPENAYLTSGEDNLALHQLPAGQVPGGVQTVHHIGFVVRRPEDVDEWADKLRGQGIPLAAEPKTHRDGARSFYFHDPDGLLIQLIYHPPISDR